ncbi:MAG: DUF1638 domain-containing protein [Steroidobacterales bacterium]
MAVVPSPGRVLVIACGALAREITALKRASGWSTLDVTCLAPELHNRPERITPAVRAAIGAARAHYERIFVAYADCGTGGALDRMLSEEGIERLPGAHCYELFATSGVFAALAEAQPGTFYLTDFLVRHFERLVAGSLGIDRHPELVSEYFRHYHRVVYLAQVADARLERQACAIAARLGLAYERRLTGYGDLASSLTRLVRRAAIAAAIPVVVERPAAQPPSR